MSATLRPFSGAAPPRPLAMSAAIPRSIADASCPRRLAMSTAIPRPLAMSAELPSPITIAARALRHATRAEISDRGKAPVMSRKRARSFTVHGVRNEAGGITELGEKSALLVEKEDESAQIQVKKECNAGETSHDDTKSSEVGNSLESKMNRPLEPEVNERKVLMINSDGEMIELGAIVYNQLACTKHVLTETDVARLESFVKSYRAENFVAEGSHGAELDYSENINEGTEIGDQEKERTDTLMKRLHDILKDTWIYPLVLNRRLLLLALVGVGAGVYIHFKVMSVVKGDYLSRAACMLVEFFGAKEIALTILKEKNEEKGSREMN